MIKICKYCGKQFEAISHRQQMAKMYCCLQCRTKSAYEKRVAKKQALAKAPKKRKFCNRKNCLYYPPEYAQNQNHCDFCYLTGQPRGCKSGTECTKYKKSTTAEKSAFRNKILTEQGVLYNSAIKEPLHC